MKTPFTLCLVDPDINAHGFIRQALQKSGLPEMYVLAAAPIDDAAHLLWIYRPGQDGHIPNDVPLQDRFQKPLRLGALWERMHRLMAIHAQYDSAQPIDFGPYSLLPAQGIVTGAGEDIRLTDKEIQIVLALANIRPAGMSRQSLMDAVWAYADGVETHTLETHIYRLRQKLGVDVIITDEAGYRLQEKK
jgi:hypothetical protein